MVKRMNSTSGTMFLLSDCRLLPVINHLLLVPELQLVLTRPSTCVGTGATGGASYHNSVNRDPDSPPLQTYNPISNYKNPYIIPRSPSKGPTHL